MIEYKKASGVLVFNDAGELALQLRAAQDDSFPSHWDFSAGGGIDQGEEPSTSAQRELREELGVEAEVKFIAHKSLLYPAWKPDITREVDLYFYRARHEGPFRIDPVEVQDVQFFSLEKIKHMIKSGEKFHPEFVLMWRKGFIGDISNSINKRIYNFFFGYTFRDVIEDEGSYSKNVLLQRNISQSYWVGKLSRTLQHKSKRSTGEIYRRIVDFTDVDHRALLGFRLAKYVGLKSLKTKIIFHSNIEGFNFLSIDYKRIDNQVFLSKYNGVALSKYLVDNNFHSIQDSDIVNKDEVVKSFVFNLWIGNYDNKEGDFLVNDNKELLSIDYHLSGPGFVSDPTLALGAWGESFDINSVSDTAWCAGGERGGVIDYVKRQEHLAAMCQQTIEKIESLPTWKIRWAMRGLYFHHQGTKDNINKDYLNFLLSRRSKIGIAVAQWVNAGFPCTPLPKDNGVL